MRYYEELGHMQQVYDHDAPPNERDTPLQQIVWRSSPGEPMNTYELKTVTYGTACAPFLTTRVLHQLADNEKTQCPKATQVLRENFYVDDLLSGADTVEKTIELRRQLDSLCRGVCGANRCIISYPIILPWFQLV